MGILTFYPAPKQPLYFEGLFILLGFFLKTNKQTKKSYATWYSVFWYWKEIQICESPQFWAPVMFGGNGFQKAFISDLWSKIFCKNDCLLTLLFTSTPEFKFIKGSFYHCLLQLLTHFQKGFGEPRKDLLEKAGSWSSCEGSPCNLIAVPFLAPTAWLDQDSKLCAASVMLN